jgi:uncharacterized protein
LSASKEPTSDRPIEPLTSDRFCFECRPDMDCFTACCARLNLQVSPYDILRLSRRLGITTTEFLETYATAVERPDALPRVALMMNESDQRCPFLQEQGCSVYEDRPGACRSYPIGRAASPSALTGTVKEAFFLVREDHCHGHDEPKEWLISEWMADQGMSDYNELNDLWMKILARQHLVVTGADRERKERMFNLASYDLDKFRVFVLEGGLLNKLELPPRLVEKLRTDDIELLRFAYSWLRLALFGEMNAGIQGR